MPELRASTARLTAQDVERAIYLDYEGNVDQLPTLLGWRVDGDNHGAILDPEFATCRDRFRARGVFLEDHESLVRQLILQAEREDRRVVSWSEHDWRHMMAALSTPDWQARSCVVYRNAIKTARPWYRKTYGRTPSEASLHHFLTCIGTPQPARYGQAVVGAALRLVRGSSSRVASMPNSLQKLVRVGSRSSNTTAWTWRGCSWSCKPSRHPGLESKGRSEFTASALRCGRERV